MSYSEPAAEVVLEEVLVAVAVADSENMDAEEAGQALVLVMLAEGQGVL